MARVRSAIVPPEAEEACRIAAAYCLPKAIRIEDDLETKRGRQLAVVQAS
jgi:hypothetical protein